MKNTKLDNNLPSPRYGMQEFPITGSQISWFHYCCMKQNCCAKAVKKFCKAGNFWDDSFVNSNIISNLLKKKHIIYF